MKFSNNFFIDKERIKKIDKFRIVYFIMFLISFALTEIGRFIYRPFIYGNKINDLGIADSIGNSGGILVQIFFGLMIINPTFKKGFRLICFFTLGYICYEFIQPYLPKGVFDWQDIIGTLIGGFVASLFLLIIKRVFKGN